MITNGFRRADVGPESFDPRASFLPIPAQRKLLKRQLLVCIVVILELLLVGCAPTAHPSESETHLANHQNQTSPNSPTIVKPAPGHFIRVKVTILGVFSPRGVFNLVVRLYKLDGLARYKFDMPDALMTLDFKPGVAVEPSAIRNVMVRAGYQPGPFKFEELPAAAALSKEPGWLTPPKVESKWAFIRWLELNF